MLESIVSAPIFCQMSVYALLLAVVLYRVDNVSGQVFVQLLEKQQMLWIFFCLPLIIQITIQSLLDLLFICSELPYFTLVVYVLCYFATTLPLRIQSISDVVYGLPWHRMPISEQKLVQAIIQRTQRDFQFRALGVLICSLESFLKVSINPFDLSVSTISKRLCTFLGSNSMNFR